jgi:aldehyde:ferredoxin oxidoreductase
MVIGRAGETKSRIAIILTDTGDASGQGGFGGVMGSKNLKAIAVRGTGTVNVVRPKELMEITHHIQKLFSRKSLGSNPYEPEEKNFQYNIWGGGYGRGSLSLLPGELLDLCNSPSSGYSQTPDGCFACPVSCRSRVKVRTSPRSGFLRPILHVPRVHGPPAGKGVQQSDLAGSQAG